MTTNVAFIGGPQTRTAFVNVAVSGDTELVAAVSGKRLRLLTALIQNGGASLVSVKFRSATTDITAAQPLATNGGGYEHAGKKYICQTQPGEALNINLDANVAVAGTIEYEEV